MSDALHHRTPAECAVTALRIVQGQIGRLQAQQARLLVLAAGAQEECSEFTALRADDDAERTILIRDVVREEIAAALRWAPVTTAHRIQVARLLSGPLRATFAALESGAISWTHVEVIAEAAQRLPGADGSSDESRAQHAASCAELQARVLPVAERSTPGRTRAAARRAVLVIDAAGAQRRREVARESRDVVVIEDADGISTLIARLATERAHAVLAQVNALASSGDDVHPTGGPDLRSALSTIGERRADALVALVLGSGSGGAAASGDRACSCSGGRGLRAHLDLVIDLPTLAALAEGRAGAADLAGAGPVPAAVVADLLADPQVRLSLRRVVADPMTGDLLDYGRRRYEVPDALRRFVVARDRTCRFPGCARRADRCQMDHLVAWDDGGSTDRDNIGPLCVRHHQLKTFARWQAQVTPDGCVEWTSPHGRTYLWHPPPITTPRARRGVIGTSAEGQHQGPQQVGQALAVGGVEHRQQFALPVEQVA